MTRSGVESQENSPRIIGRPVPPLLPSSGHVFVLLVGEAPGPRGADKSGFPFFGDAAGKHMYDVLRAMQAIVLPARVDELPWDGTAFANAKLQPLARGVALGNAFDRCPTDDGKAFRAPTRAELEGAPNIDRLVREIATLSARGLRGIVTLGRVAAKTIDLALTRSAMPTLLRRSLPHPSAQGLLSMAPNRGRGARMADLQLAWQARLQEAVIACGLPAEPSAPSV
jgi:hypothetical protein